MKQAEIYKNRTEEFLEAILTLVEELQAEISLEKEYWNLTDDERTKKIEMINAISYSRALATDKLNCKERDLLHLLAKTLYETLPNFDLLKTENNE